MAVVGSGHEGDILGLVGEDHQLCAGEAVPLPGGFGGFPEDFPHAPHHLHVDAGPAVGHIEGGADPLGAHQHFREGFDEFPIRRRGPLLHLGGIAAHDVDAGGGGRHVQGLGQFHHSLPVMSGGHVGGGGDRQALVDDADAVLSPHLVAGLHQVSGIALHFRQDLAAHHLRIRVAAVHEIEPQGDRAHIQIFLLNHFHGVDDLLGA